MVVLVIWVVFWRWGGAFLDGGDHLQFRTLLHVGQPLVVLIQPVDSVQELTHRVLDQLIFEDQGRYGGFDPLFTHSFYQHGDLG